MTLTVHIEKYHLAEGEERSRQQIDIPLLPSSLNDHKVLSFIRSEPTWVRPTVYPNLSAHPYFSSSLVLLKSPDWCSTIAIYPIGSFSVDHNLVISNGIVHSNLIRSVEGGEHAGWVVCAKADGEDQRGIVERVVEEARKVVRPESESEDDGIDFRSVGFWDGLGVCSWEALSCNETRPNKDVLLSLVPSYPISTFLIDDGWQSTRTPHPRQRLLRSFESWDKFGGTLNEVVALMKSKGVKEVGVWVTLNGYWNGIDPEGDLKERYDCHPWKMGRRGQARDVDGLEEDDEEGLKCWLPNKRMAEQFWIDWFSYLKEEGIGFVKVDNQAMYDPMVEIGANEAIKSMWKGMLSAAVKVWGSIDRVIMCMSHSPLMLNGPGGLDFDRLPGRLVFRNSDDFNIKYPDRHTDFIQWNTYTSILTSCLSFTNDFDMFSTTPIDRLPIYHALLRALSPGPILISDSPGSETDTKLLNRLTGMDKMGRVRCMKMIRPARVLYNRWFWDNIRDRGTGPALVAASSAPWAGGATMGAWNVRNKEDGGDAEDSIKLVDVEDAIGRRMVKGDKYVLWDTCLFGGDNLTDNTGSEIKSENESEDESVRGRYKVFEAGSQDGYGLKLKKEEVALMVISNIRKLGNKEFSILGYLDKLAPLAGLRISLGIGSVNVHSTFKGSISIFMFNIDTDNTDNTHNTDNTISDRAVIGGDEAQKASASSLRVVNEKKEVIQGIKRQKVQGGGEVWIIPVGTNPGETGNEGEGGSWTISIRI